MHTSETRTPTNDSFSTARNDASKIVDGAVEI